MRLHFVGVVSFLSLFLALNVSAVVRYVDLNSLDPKPPYTNWATASTNIQVAIDAAVSGDEILVANGIYSIGGRAVSGTMTNRVVLNSGVSLRSVNGPEFTVIQGRQVPGTTNGDGAIRCVYIGHANARISGFTLTGGATRTNGDYAQERSGGGVSCTTKNPSVSNCVIVGNSATGNGGGAFYGNLTDCVLKDNWTTGNGGGASGGKLKNCRVLFNRATLGGGIHSSTSPGEIYSTWIENCSIIGNVATSLGGGVNSSTLNQCTVTGNRALQGGGVNESVLTNCIVSQNFAGDGADYLDSELEYSCATPLPPTGNGNIEVNPQLPDGVHLIATSPCRGVGLSNTSNSGTDIDNEKWATPPSIGCDEYWPDTAKGMLSVSVRTSHSTVASGFPVHLTGDITGNASVSVWDFGDGTAATNRILATHSWAVPGDYQVVLWAANDSMPSGVSATSVVHVIEPPVHYVAPASANPVPPYTSWATAATNIQDAIDASTMPGAVVLVTNGTYATGGRALNGGTTNRVAVHKPVIVRSVNGPDYTKILGYQVPGNVTGVSAVRCVYLSDGACLDGFTLSDGATRYFGDAAELNGGALLCESSRNIVTNCMITNSVAEYYGGGAYSGSLFNCTVRSNSAAVGGGTAYSVVNGCTVTQNRASTGGGAYRGTLNNSVLRANWAESHAGGSYRADLNTCFVVENVSEDAAGGMSGGTGDHCTIVRNTARDQGGGAYSASLRNSTVLLNQSFRLENVAHTTLDYCCTTPLPASGVGNVEVDPEFADLPHLSPESPLLGRADANSKAATELDLDGEPWRAVASIGCDEYWPGGSTGMLSGVIRARFTTLTANWPMTFTADITGRANRNVWDFGDGAAGTNRLTVSHAWSTTGDYEVKLTVYNDTYPVGISTSVWVHVVPVATHYVAANNPAPQAPFLSWATATADIQSAVDVAAPGATILVSNGVYTTGGRAFEGSTNRVLVNKPLKIQSVKGPEVTIIEGMQIPGSVAGEGAIRCVYLADEASLIGFTLTNGGATQGGGAWCASSSGVLSNCIITGSAAYSGAGGVWMGSLYHCTILSNFTTSTSSHGGGACYSILYNCTLLGNSGSFGGGASASTLYNCLISSNSQSGVYGSRAYNCTLQGNSANSGGGAWHSTLVNCLLTDNSAIYYGGGAYSGSLQNCTLVRNTGRGAYASKLQNCIIYFNSEGNYDSDAEMSYCCTTPMPAEGAGNITNAPLFADPDHGNFRLHPASPCIDAGNNAYALAVTDLGDNPRIFGGVVDMGAYEAQSPRISIPKFAGMTMENDGSFKLQLTNVSGASFVVLTSTNLALPEISWSVLSNRLVEWPTGSGQYQFTDDSTTNSLQRFYRVRFP